MLRPEVDFTGISRVSDEALMKAITRRQPKALNEFFSRHGNRIKSVMPAGAPVEVQALKVVSPTLGLHHGL